MIKRCYDSQTYQKMGHPDLGSVMFMKCQGIKRWGSVVLVHFTGEKSRHKGKIMLGIDPFKPKK